MKCVSFSQSLPSPLLIFSHFAINPCTHSTGDAGVCSPRCRRQGPALHPTRHQWCCAPCAVQSRLGLSPLSRQKFAAAVTSSENLFFCKATSPFAILHPPPPHTHTGVVRCGAAEAGLGFVCFVVLNPVINYSVSPLPPPSPRRPCLPALYRRGLRHSCSRSLFGLPRWHNDWLPPAAVRASFDAWLWGLVHDPSREHHGGLCLQLFFISDSIFRILNHSDQYLSHMISKCYMKWYSTRISLDQFSLGNHIANRSRLIWATVYSISTIIILYMFEVLNYVVNSNYCR